jgi:hypothetical protein
MAENPTQQLIRTGTKYAVGIPLKMLIAGGHGFLDGLEEAMEFAWGLSPSSRQPRQPL